MNLYGLSESKKSGMSVVVSNKKVETRDCDISLYIVSKGMVLIGKK